MSSKEIPNGFRMTELGPIPVEWDVVKANEIFIRITDGTHETPKKLDKGIPLIKSKQIKDGKVNFGDIDYYISIEDHETINKRSKVDRFDILLSMIGTVGEVALVKEDPNFSIKNVGLFKLNSNHDLAIYSHYYFQSNLAKKHITENLSGTSQKYITLEKLRQFPIILPSPPEQRTIAFVLSTVQQAKEKTNAVITATKELKKSLMKHLFTYGPVPREEAENVPLKETEIGMVPEAWDVLRLKDLAEKMKAGGTPSRKEPKYWGDDIPFVLIKDMTSCGLYLSNTKEKITEDGLKDSNTWIVPPNSLLLSMYATIGETAINTIPLTTNQAILAIIPKSNFDIVFGAYLIKFHANRLIMENVQSTQKNVNKGIVENFKIPLPSLTLQQKIASILSAVDEKIEKEETKKKSLEELFKTLLHNLMTGKLRVNHLEV